jgi:membrane-associated protease RseP (regulator of RpoE activity)
MLMKFKSKRKIILVLFILLTFVSVGCAHRKNRQSLYSGWGQQLSGAFETGSSQEDISYILGSPPIKCELVELPAPKIGVNFAKSDENKKEEKISSAIIKGVSPYGAAYKAGIRAGEAILKVNGSVVSSSKEALDALKANARWGQSVLVETTAGSFTIFLQQPSETKQCYWEIHAGAVGSSSGGAYVDKYGGFANHSSSAYDRFFRASCRFFDGHANTCTANWQE